MNPQTSMRLGSGISRNRGPSSSVLCRRRAYSAQAPTTRRGPISNTILVSVPQESAYIVERFGKYSRTLAPGLAFLVPLIDRIPYAKSLKEIAVPVPSQSALTLDNITLEIDGTLYIKTVDAYKAAYGVEDAEFAVNQLAQTTMRHRVGQMTLDEVLRSRGTLSGEITRSVNEAAEAWGVKCLRYEIREIQPPKSVLLAMHRAAVDRLFG